MIHRSCGIDLSFFFFQAEDGIRDHCVTGVQTCALPISHAEHCAKAAAWLDRPVIVDGLVVYVYDLEAHHAAAVAAGARVISGLEMNPLQRQYRVEDLDRKSVV